MPWATPTLRSVREMVRDSVRANLPGADANVPNSLLRIMSDAMGALCHLTLQYAIGYRSTCRIQPRQFF